MNSILWGNPEGDFNKGKTVFSKVEQLAWAKETLMDAEKQLLQAEKEVKDALEWQEKVKGWVVDARKELNALLEEDICEHCDGTGKVTVGEFDNIEERNCTLCNRKESIEEQMDDNS